MLQERTLNRPGSKPERGGGLPGDRRYQVRLDELSRASQFRSDPYHIASTSSPWNQPPLRERREDILQLFEHFLQQSSLRSDRRAAELTNRPLSSLMSHDWPGNA